MPSTATKQVVFEYWFRILIGSDISIENISKIAGEFAADLELFDASLCHKKIKIENEGKLISKITTYTASCNAYGTFTATAGYIYHWKLKVIECKDTYMNQLNIGVVDAKQAPDLLNRSWWRQPNGYSYFSGNGKMYCKYSTTTFGAKYGTNDIIDIWLNLKDKYQLSFAKNGKDIGKTKDVDGSVDYKLAVGLYGQSKKIEIVWFEISD